MISIGLDWIGFFGRSNLKAVWSGRSNLKAVWGGRKQSQDFVVELIGLFWRRGLRGVSMIRKLFLGADDVLHHTVVMVRPWKAGNYLRNK